MAHIERYEYQRTKAGEPVGKPEARWRVWDRDLDGRQVAKVFPKRHLADKWIRDRANAKEQGTLAGRDARRLTFRNLWDDLHAAHEYAPNTLATHESAWRYLEPLANVPVGNISRDLIARTLARVERPGMRAKVKAVAGAVFSHAVDRGLLTANPAKSQGRSKTRAAHLRERPSTEAEQRRLSWDELQRLTAAAPERYQALIRLMAHVGLRPGEAMALTVEKIDFERRTLRIDTAVFGSTKTGEVRTLPLPAVVAELLRDHIARFPDPGGLVFTNREGRQVERGAFRKTLIRAAERAGIPDGLTPNDLRHTAAAFAVAAGGTVLDVQRMLGHARPSITLDTYAYLFRGSLEGLADRLDAAIRDAWF